MGAININNSNNGVSIMAAYMVAVCEITNMTPDMKVYAQKSAALVEKLGGKYVVRGPAAENVEGEILIGKMLVISEFPNMADLNAFVKGDEYQNNIKPLRAGTGNYHVAFYEGAAS
jgi:uncharacterized protein (DUF1330 family)